MLINNDCNNLPCFQTRYKEDISFDKDYIYKDSIVFAKILSKENSSNTIFIKAERISDNEFLNGHLVEITISYEKISNNEPTLDTAS